MSRAAVASAFSLLLAAGPGAGQRLLDLDARAGAGPDALARGAIAVLWNPAGMARIDVRFEALAVDVRAPESTGLGGIALAGTARLDEETTVGVGYLHASVDGIRRTTTSPLGDEGEIEVSEDLFNLALSRRLGDATDVGAVVRYGREAQIAGGESAVDVGVGVSHRPALPWVAEVGAAVSVADDGADWLAGIAIEPPLQVSDWRVQARYGFEHAFRVDGFSHRVAASGIWSGGVGVEVGIAVEPGAEGSTVSPVLGASFRLERYQVAVLRESLANGLGAVYSFRFGVLFE